MNVFYLKNKKNIIRTIYNIYNKKTYLGESLSLNRFVANDLIEIMAAVCRRLWIFLVNVP